MKDLLQKKNGVVVSRIDDLLIAGMDMDRLIDNFIRINKEVWDKIVSAEGYVWTEEMLKSQFNICPDTIYCAFENGKMVATLTYIRINKEDLNVRKTWLEKTYNGFLTTHRTDGNLVFGVDLSVLAKAPKKVSDKILLTAIFIGVMGGGIKSAYLGARIPSYHKHEGLSVEEYVFSKRKNGKPLDPELYFYAKNGFKTVEIIPEYMDDPESLNYGVLVRWDNPFYKITRVFPFLKSAIKLFGKAFLLQVPEIISKK